MPARCGVVAVFHVAELHVAGLRHEAVDDAVEGDIVIGALAHQLLDLRDMLRREVRPQRDRHVAVLQRDDHGVFGIGGEAPAMPPSRAASTTNNEASFLSCMDVSPEFYFDLNLAVSASATTAGTKGRMSPPIDAIWRTSVAVMVRTEGLAGRNTVCRSGAMVSFMPAICIS